MNEEIGESDLEGLLDETIDNHLEAEVEHRIPSGVLSNLDKMISVYSVCKTMGAKTVRDVAKLISERKVPFSIIKDWMDESMGAVYGFEGEAIRKGYHEFKGLMDEVQAQIDLTNAIYDSHTKKQQGYVEPEIRFHPGRAASERGKNLSYGGGNQ